MGKGNKDEKDLFSENETYFKKKRRLHLFTAALFIVLFLISISVLVFDYLQDGALFRRGEYYIIMAVFLVCSLYLLLSGKKIRMIVIRSRKITDPTGPKDSWIALKDIKEVSCKTIPSDGSGSISITLKDDKAPKGKVYLGRFNSEDTYTLLFIFQQNQIPQDKGD